MKEIVCNDVYFFSILPHLKITITMRATNNISRDIRMMYVCFIVQKAPYVVKKFFWYYGFLNFFCLTKIHYLWVNKTILSM